MRARSVIRMLLPLSACLVLACANETDDTPNQLIPDEKPKAEGPCGDLLVEGDWYTFTSLSLNDIGGVPPESLLKSQLNGVWERDIANKELNIVFQIVSATAESIELKVLSGARVGAGDTASFCVLPETQVNIAVPIGDDGSIGPSEETDLIVYSGTQAAPKTCVPGGKAVHGIPVARAVFNAGCNAETGLVQGKITGAVGKTELNGTCSCLILTNDLSDDFCGNLKTELLADPPADSPCDACKGDKGDGTEYNYINLGALIPGLNGGKDILYECEMTDGADGACIDAAFSALKLAAPPTDCP